MNKEVKELIDRLKQDSDCEDVYWVGYVDGMNCDVEITNKEMNLLLDYINQLETIINEVIDYVMSINSEVDCMIDGNDYYDIRCEVRDKILSILKKGNSNE